MQTLVVNAKQLTKGETCRLTASLKFIPQERHHWIPGGCAKSAMEIYLQCAGEYLNMAKFLRGDIPLPWEEVLEAATAHLTFDKARELMQDNENQFLLALDEMDEARMDETIESPWGEKMTWGQFILSASYHLAYHCGQLNYIQTLLGV
jgi:hypothetical protein